MTASDIARLVVLRHAKSAWPEGVDDHERPLGPRGERDAPAAGRWLRENEYVPDLVVCSTARRARDTWALVAPELGGTEPGTVFERAVYGATAADLLAVVRRTPEERRTLLLIGHQPGVQDLVLSLASGAADESTLEWAGSMFPTCAVAVLELPGTWADLAPDSAALTVFAVPRGRRKG